MDNALMASLFTFLGSAIGTVGGILVSQKLTNYRLEQLEKKVEEHNKVKERTTELETWKDGVNLEIKEVKDRIGKLENFHMKG